MILECEHGFIRKECHICLTAQLNQFKEVLQRAEAELITLMPRLKGTALTNVQILYSDIKNTLDTYDLLGTAYLKS